MPVARRRAGLTADEVVRAAAEIADETSFANVTLGLVAERLGVRPPSLYKHVDGLADLQHRVAVLAMTELGEIASDAAAGLAGRDALAALAHALRGYVTAHPGRYTATIGAEFTGPDDPLLKAGTRVIELIGAVLRGYRIDEPAIGTPSGRYAAPARLGRAAGGERLPVVGRPGRELRGADRLHGQRPARPGRARPCVLRLRPRVRRAA